jgi:hypothetical protein
MAKLWVLIVTYEIHSLHQNSKLAIVHSKRKERSSILRLVTELTREQLFKIKVCNMKPSSNKVLFEQLIVTFHLQAQ